MSLGRGVMAVWNDLEPGREAEFDAWYRRQHIPERLHQPGFLEARRYLADEGIGSPRYCAFYWLESIAALKTPQYLACLAHPTRWTRRVMPWFREMGRSPCAVIADVGHGIGGMMIWMAATGAPARGSALHAQLAPVWASLCADPAIVRAQLWDCDPSARAQFNPEERLRTARDEVADCIVCIEGAAARALNDAADRIRSVASAAAPRVELRVSPCYRLLWRMRAAEAPPPCSDDDANVSL